MIVARPPIDSMPPRLPAYGAEIVVQARQRPRTRARSRDLPISPSVAQRPKSAGRAMGQPRGPTKQHVECGAWHLAARRQ